jgi:hypothetical protein
MSSSIKDSNDIRNKRQNTLQRIAELSSENSVNLDDELLDASDHVNSSDESNPNFDESYDS